MPSKEFRQQQKNLEGRKRYVLNFELLEAQIRCLIKAGALLTIAFCEQGVGALKVTIDWGNIFSFIAASSSGSEQDKASGNVKGGV
jgi:hypothetical protein